MKTIIYHRTRILILAILLTIFFSSIYFQKPQNKPINPSPSSNNWQIQKTTTNQFRLFSAYLDPRTHSIRILGLYQMVPSNQKFFCKLWYPNHGESSFVRAQPFQLTEDLGFDKSYMMTCPLGSNRVPEHVSLVEKETDDATNLFQIYRSDNVGLKKRNFVVCVRAQSFGDVRNPRLIEWIETIKAMGAEKINFYASGYTGDIFQYYAEKHLVEITSSSFDDYNVNENDDYVIFYNDCLYKHIHLFKFVVILDLDEMIVPNGNQWIDLLLQLEKNHFGKSSFMAQNYYFFDEFFLDKIPNDFHMLGHIYRAQNHTRSSIYNKGFHDLMQVEALSSHYPFKCLKDCDSVEIHPRLAKMHHYGDCSADLGLQKCEILKKNFAEDRTLWEFREKIEAGFNVTVNGLKTFKLN